jgi:hypothetical protein
MYTHIRILVSTVFMHKPILVSTAQGDDTYSWHVGASVLYHLDLRGFRVYLDGIKASKLNGHFHVNYLSIEIAVDADGTHSTNTTHAAVLAPPSQTPSSAPTAAKLSSVTPVTPSSKKAATRALLTSVAMVLVVLVLFGVVLYRRNKQQQLQAVDVSSEGEKSHLVAAHPGGSRVVSSGVDVQSGSV